MLSTDQEINQPTNSSTCRVKCPVFVALFTYYYYLSKPFPKRLILDSSKLKEFADDNFKFNENDRKSIQMGRKHCGKRRNCSLRAISPFPTMFSKDL